MSSLNDLLRLVSEEKKNKKALAETNLSDFLTLIEEAKPAKKTQELLDKQSVEIEKEKDENVPVLTKEETDSVLSEIFGQIKKEKEFHSKLKEATFDDFFGIVEKVYGPPKPEVSPEIAPIELEIKQNREEETVEETIPLEVVETQEEALPAVEEIKEEVIFAEKSYVESLVEELTKREDFEALQNEIKLLKKLYDDFKKTVIKDISKLGTKVSPGALYNSSGGGAVNLKDLDDVNAKNVLDGYVLTYNATLKKYVFAPPSGGTGSGSTTNITKIAAEPIMQNTAVIVSGDLVYNASSLDVDSIGFVSGLAGNDANLGDLVEVKYNVEINNPSWNFSTNSKLAFLGTDGTVQETVEPNALIVQVVGRIISPTKIYIENGFAAIRTP